MYPADVVVQISPGCTLVVTYVVSLRDNNRYVIRTSSCALLSRGESVFISRETQVSSHCWSSSVVEHVLGKDGVTGSITVSSSRDGEEITVRFWTGA